MNAVTCVQVSVIDKNAMIKIFATMNCT